NTNGESLGFKTIITPSKDKIKAHIRKVGKLMEAEKAAPQSGLIAHLNPLIQGWANYYSCVSSKDIFGKVYSVIFSQLVSWLTNRHPNKSWEWIRKKYWRTVGNDNWVFMPPNSNLRLTKHTQTKIVYHTKVQGNRSPFDGDLIYWSSRIGKHPKASKTVAILLKRQSGRSADCGLYFQDGDCLEIDHIIPRSQYGKGNYDNLQLLHRHCHDVKTANDNKLYVCTSKIDEDYLFDNSF
ncbi:MAG: group II intron maturase-specific domain-containing protein, partial [Microcystaceae cyanobacterium]